MVMIRHQGGFCPLFRFTGSLHLRWILSWRSADEEFAVLDAAGERLAGDDVAAQNALCQQRLHRVLHVTAQRTRAKLRIVGRVDDELLGLGRQLAVELLVLGALVQRGNLQGR